MGSLSVLELQDPKGATVNLSAVSDKFTPIWCVDCGANRTVTPHITNFTSDYTSANITLTVAKQNIAMQAIGMGTCTLHCVDNVDRPCKILLKDVLHVPLANRSLLSTSALSAQGYQAVLPSSTATFTPGLYIPRNGVSTPSLSPRFIGFDTINGLHYIASRNDTEEPLSPTKDHAAARFSRQLGHCSLQTLGRR